MVVNYMGEFPSEAGKRPSSIQWTEPTAFRKAVNKAAEHRKPLDSLKIASGIFVVVLGLRWMYSLHHTSSSNPPQWGAMVIFSLIIALFVAYGLPALFSVMSTSIVILSEKGINNNRMAYGRWVFHFWEWEQISRAALVSEEIGSGNHRVLKLIDNNGQLLATLALSPQINETEVVEYLSTQGVQADQL